MTLIQPGQSYKGLNSVIAGLVVLTIVLAVWVVSLYNQLMNLHHGVAEVRAEIQDIETANAELKERMFVATNSAKLQEIAASRGLVEEKNPKYFPVDPAWSLASRY